MKHVKITSAGVWVARLALFAAVQSSTGSLAQAEEVAHLVESSVESSDEGEHTGAFLALAMTPAIAGRRGVVSSLAGYDSGARTGLWLATAEVALWHNLALRVGATNTEGGHAMRPSLGARVQLLDERRFGIDAGAAVFYRAEGFTEPEGEIETALTVGRHLGESYLIANLVYGQDPEGRERDGELRLGLLYPLGSRFVVGGDGRARLDLGSDRTRRAERGEPTADLMVGPVGTVRIDLFVLCLQGGASAVRAVGQTTWGAFVLAGVGSAF
jgi:hypothetical protein